ncbi:MAG: O-antigen ligase family protein [Gemmatimonadaceae bacterium]|nr:O-antigen ligase family protein [Gemmatimonadaceae bacterium]
MVVLATAVLTLTRSRAAWLTAGVMVMALPFLWLVINHPRARRAARTTVLRWVLPAAFGSVFAITVPSALNWGPREYMSTAGRVADLSNGSGAGRLRQAQVTMRMIRAWPLGVGPGNWTAVYARFTDSSDPSFDAELIYPVPRMPRGDLLSLTSEYGLPGLALMALFVTGLVRRAWRGFGSPKCRVREAAAMSVALLLAVGALGLADPVIRRAATLGLVATQLGAHAGVLWNAHSFEVIERREVWFRRAIVGAGVLMCLSAAYDTARESLALRMLATLDSARDLEIASRLAPGNIEVQITIASAFIAAGECAMARPHLEWAKRLQPYSRLPGRLASRCIAAQ